MPKSALEACQAAITADSIECEELIRAIKYAAFRGDGNFLNDIACWAASYVDVMQVKQEEIK